MLILNPYPHVTIWGGVRLGKYINQDVANIGHLYTVRGTKSDSNVILNSEMKGMKLYHYFLENRVRWKLEEYEEFPISVALVDASENLSVQVHPKDEAAYKYEAVARGKNESFYLLEEPESGKMINGCKCGSEEELRQCVALEDWDKVIDYLPVKKGDYVYVPAGTLHAMTKGALTYEIEENCAYTYRLYDYDRVDSKGHRRGLDTEKAISSIEFAQKSHTRQYGTDEIIEMRYATSFLYEKKGYANHSSNIICLTIIEGSGYADGIAVKEAMSIVLEPGEIVNHIDIRQGIAARIL